MMNLNTPAPSVLTAESTPDEATCQAIGNGLTAYNDSVAPEANMEALSIVGRDAERTVQAGLLGTTFFGWLFIKWFWVAEAYRRQGIGSDILRQAEGIARDRRCRGAYLDTFSFQAQGFYEGHGYKEFGRLDNIPPGHARIWLAKSL